MTRCLADSHIAIWFLNTPEKLSQAQMDILVSPAEVCISVASLWEIAIKSSLGKLNAPQLSEQALRAIGFEVLPIEARHTEMVRVLPFQGAHRDPFDRLLIAQAMVERLTILTSDRQFAGYGVEII